MKKQTAVEFLENQYTCNGKLTAIDFYQAKEMQKKQIKDSYKQGYKDSEHKVFKPITYYNETYTNA